MDSISPEISKALCEAIFPRKDIEYTTIEEYVLQTLQLTQTAGVV